MTTATWTGDELENYKESRKVDLPDVILVRKVKKNTIILSLISILNLIIYIVIIIIALYC